jgi:hypothetical protein
MGNPVKSRGNLFGFLGGYLDWHKNLNLAPTTVSWSRAASSTNSVAAFGVFRDAVSL